MHLKNNPINDIVLQYEINLSIKRQIYISNKVKQSLRKKYIMEHNYTYVFYNKIR